MKTLRRRVPSRKRWKYEKHEKNLETPGAGVGSRRHASFAGGPPDLLGVLRDLPLLIERRLHGSTQRDMQLCVPEDGLLRVPVISTSQVPGRAGDLLPIGELP